MRSPLFKFLGPALVVAGGVLLYYGYQARESAQSKLGELVTGTPSDHAMQLLIGGGLVLALGLGLTLGGARKG